LLQFTPLGSISEEAFLNSETGYMLGWVFLGPLQVAIDMVVQDLPKTSGFI